MEATCVRSCNKCEVPGDRPAPALDALVLELETLRVALEGGEEVGLKDPDAKVRFEGEGWE
jgi:hypothetical protein